jgi:sodium/bile acid cotransporter 7
MCWDKFGNQPNGETSGLLHKHAMTDSRKSKFKLDWFLTGMGVAVFLAWLFPDPGAKGGSMHPEIVTKAGVALIFFLHGVALPFAALKAGTLQWKLHLVVQGCTFLLFPLLGFVLSPLFRNLGGIAPPELALGIFYLCALPSTVSSSVAMTAAARGNVAAAVFNATLSSLIGVVLTPLWVRAGMQTGGGPIDLGGVILDLVKWLVLPLAVGQLCRPFLGTWASKNKPFINILDRGTILLLVYTSFCDSMKWGVWSGHGIGAVLVTAVVSVLLFYLVLSIVGAICRALKFPVEDQIAAVFCGSKKSLASGVPMAQLIFAGNPSLSMILLPIMIYHPLQLIICGALAGKWAAREEK